MIQLGGMRGSSWMKNVYGINSQNMWHAIFAFLGANSKLSFKHVSNKDTESLSKL